MVKRPAKPPEAPIDEATIDKIVVLLVTIRSRADVVRLCTAARGDGEKARGLDLSQATAQRAIDEALRRITLTATIDHDFELGRAQTRLADLFQKANTVQDFKAALAIQKELNRLLALYPGKGSAVAPTDQAEDADALAELVAARAHLAPLVGADDDEPLDEIARRVVGLFTSR